VDGWRRIRGSARQAVVGMLIVLLLLAAGISCYAIAAAKGVDIEAAQVAALRAGEERGTAAGRRDGFARGFKATRDRAYRAAYREAYVSAYLSQFERAGLPAPADIKVRRP
jgi:hypothetical protein